MSHTTAPSQSPPAGASARSEARDPERALVRGIGRWAAVALMVNAIVGAGIFGLPSRLHALAGVRVLWAFAACALIVGAIALCCAEVSSRFRGTGGAYLYTRHAFGERSAFCVGWTMWLARLASVAVMANVAASYAGFFWAPLAHGPWRAALLAALLAGFALLNVAGVRGAAGAFGLFTIAKLLPLVGFVLVGAFFLEPLRFAVGAPPEAGKLGVAVTQLIFAFGGFEGVAVVAGEVRDPERDVPFATLLALGGVTVLYLGIQIVAIGTLPDLAASERPLADASVRFLGGVGGAVMAAGALVSTVGCMGGSLLVGPRMLYALAEDRHLPSFFGVVHPRLRTPHVAILITAGVALALALSGSFAQLLTLAVVSRLASYAATAAALPVLRRRDGPAPFTVRLGMPIALGAVAACLWLAVGSGALPLRDVGIAVAAGLLIRGIERARLARRPPTGRGG